MKAASQPASTVSTLALLAALTSTYGCRGWTMDYGDPAAQFDAREAIAVAADYLGEKVSVRGEVLTVNAASPDQYIVKMKGGLEAVFKGVIRRDDLWEIGEVAYIDGIVAVATSTGVVLSPAMMRDPTASFDPERR